MGQAVGYSSLQVRHHLLAQAQLQWDQNSPFLTTCHGSTSSWCKTLCSDFVALQTGVGVGQES